MWSFAEMRAFAAAAGAAQTGRKLVLGEDGEPLRVPSALDAWRPVYAEAMVRVLCDCGLRLGELLPIERDDLRLGPCAVPQCPATGPHLHLRRTAHEGVTQDGTKTTHGLAGMEAERLVPIPPALDVMLRAAAADRHAARVPAAEGRLFRERNFYRDVWHPAREAAGMDCTPHSFRAAIVDQPAAPGATARRDRRRRPCRRRWAHARGDARPLHVSAAAVVRRDQEAVG
jgi:integrase